MQLYVEPGEYSAKFVIDSRRSAKTTITQVLVVDADGKPLEAQARRWGTKLHVSFSIGAETPDGASLIDFILDDGKRERFKFWVVKP